MSTVVDAMVEQYPGVGRYQADLIVQRARKTNSSLLKSEMPDKLKAEILLRAAVRHGATKYDLYCANYTRRLGKEKGKEMARLLVHEAVERQMQAMQDGMVVLIHQR